MYMLHLLVEASICLLYVPSDEQLRMSKEEEVLCSASKAKYIHIYKREGGSI